ncbi:hypothetical protein Thiosp_01336 [Thiorhodovibrio litoralis]|nr:hypothetical protein Thiosp_01336 [Thiorhodovibrio litoralis]
MTPLERNQQPEGVFRKILKNRRLVVNVKGNDYRLVVSVAYCYQAVYVKFIGSHREYDAVAG